LFLQINLHQEVNQWPFPEKSGNNGVFKLGIDEIMSCAGKKKG